MNKIKNLEALEVLKGKLPSQPVPAPPTQKMQPKVSISAAEEEAYGAAFDALLSLWQAVEAMPPFMRTAAVDQAQALATLRIQPLIKQALKATG